MVWWSLRPLLILACVCPLAMIPLIAITVEEGGGGEELDPCAEELLPVSSLAMSSWPSLLETFFEELPFTDGEVEEAGVFSNSISRICSCRISSLESGIKYLRTYKKDMSLGHRNGVQFGVKGGQPWRPHYEYYLTTQYVSTEYCWRHTVL